jgi:hypothetical protein
MLERMHELERRQHLAHGESKRILKKSVDALSDRIMKKIDDPDNRCTIFHGD